MQASQRSAILLVEDQPDDAFLFLRQVEALGHFDVFVAGDGPDALRYLEALPAAGATLPVAIFINLRLPGMNGLELLVEIAKRTALARIPCFLLSDAGEKVTSGSRATGAHGIFDKPVSATSLALALATV